jgi:PAS domain S-box-containing protein
MNQQPSTDPPPPAAADASPIAAEKRLRETEERYRRIIEMTMEGVWTIDAAGRTDFINRRAAEILGYTVEEMLGRSPLDFLFPEDVPEGQQELDLRRRGISAHRDFRMRRRDGSEIWVNSAGSPLLDDQGRYCGSLAVFSEVSDRKGSDKRLKEAEEQYRRFFFADDLTGDFLATTDGRLLLCNRALAQMLGYDSIEAIMAEPAFSIFPNVRERDAHLATLREQRKVSPHECRINSPNGKEITVVESLVGIFAPDGALAEIQGYWLDITERKRMEERLLQTERLAAIGQLVAGVAHESGNALQGSQACLERLIWRVQDRPEALELVKRIEGELDRLFSLYEDIRGFAAPLKLSPDAWDLAEIWRQAWGKLAAARSGRDIVLREPDEGADLYCEVDAFRMQQVFLNILENSLTACSDPVRIEMEASQASLEGRPAVELVLRDNGPGLGPEQRKRLFEPFYTTKTRGTGLGMTIAQRIVEAHGGRIAIGDSRHWGTEIVITLPRRQP